MTETHWVEDGGVIHTAPPTSLPPLPELLGHDTPAGHQVKHLTKTGQTVISIYYSLDCDLITDHREQNIS